MKVIFPWLTVCSNKGLLICFQSENETLCTNHEREATHSDWSNSSNPSHPANSNTNTNVTTSKVYFSYFENNNGHHEEGELSDGDDK
jgi:hypothetical protein